MTKGLVSLTSLFFLVSLAFFMQGFFVILYMTKVCGIGLIPVCRLETAKKKNKNVISQAVFVFK